MNMESKDLIITDDGTRLKAILDMPEGYTEGDKCPIAIVIHGLTGYKEERHITAVAKTFNELGIATIRTDMFGHGKSDGDFERHNMFKWLNNAMTIVDHVKQLDFVSDIYVCGHSQGGLASLFLAGIESDVFKAALLLSPASMAPEGSRSGKLFRHEFDPHHIPDEIYVSDTEKVNGNYIRAYQLLDEDFAIKNYKRPVLIVHGTEDEAIPVHFSEELVKKYSDARLVIIEGDDHCYDHHLDQVLDAVRAFIEEVRD